MQEVGLALSAKRPISCGNVSGLGLAAPAVSSCAASPPRVGQLMAPSAFRIVGRRFWRLQA
jgi:hypothetical protein